MAPFDALNEFDAALEWQSDDDSLLEMEASPPSWPAEDPQAS